MALVVSAGVAVTAPLGLKEGTVDRLLLAVAVALAARVPPQHESLAVAVTVRVDSALTVGGFDGGGVATAVALSGAEALADGEVVPDADCAGLLDAVDVVEPEAVRVHVADAEAVAGVPVPDAVTEREALALAVAGLDAE